MIIRVDIKPELEAELARQAAAQGRGIEAYAATLLEEATRRPANGGGSSEERARAAGARIRELRKNVSLGGLTIRQLIDEGRH
jgi:hypothetical protein